MKRLELGALFHDIGKIGIPNSILLKPAPLTEDERLLIETHPELGERIIAPIDQLRDVCGIVRACHERWDGEGYPDRKAGDEIPLEARIIFACDAFHAMTTDRPYRRALDVDEALRRLREASGTQFDPTVVEVCLRVLEATPPAVPSGRVRGLSPDTSLADGCGEELRNPSGYAVSARSNVGDRRTSRQFPGGGRRPPRSPRTATATRISPPRRNAHTSSPASTGS